ncbi:MAG: DNA topoisomerase I [Pseudomonadota bacterium]
MTKHLVIVESPAKAKTIKKYLGKDYEVMASYGHVRDLVPKEGAVDPEHGFAMRYEVIDKNARHVEAIRKAMAKADDLLLATDPDREGEAISWHLYEILRESGEISGKSVQRVVFHEITQRAIREAVEHPRALSMDLINAQQARRALDYLVGFNLSPLLWKKISPGLSAGRVQSPALRLIAEREAEIERFAPREYWSVIAQSEREGSAFPARLQMLRGEKVEQFTLGDEGSAQAARTHLLAVAAGRLRVARVERKQRRRNPQPPFTTSTLQQEAVRKLGFSASRTMRIAQQLYEGVDIGNGSVGLITYMRTDSVNLAAESVQEIRGLILERYGSDYLPDAPLSYKTKSKNAQEAHEAIRPTSARHLPEQVKAHLNAEQFRLYEMIWKRAVACQMAPAVLDTVAVDLAAGEGDSFRANGSTLRFPGFMSLYREDVDDEKGGEEDDRRLPPMEEGDEVQLRDILAEQHFTEPPPRYTEASLVKTLEEYGIGRPSTYASIISTLQAREYVLLESRRFRPTDMGRIVNGFLTDHFTQYVDYDFTARLEDDLDAVSRGETDWVPLMGAFWKPFRERVDAVSTGVSRQEVTQGRELGIDPASGKPVSVRLGRFGPFAQIGTKDDEEKPRFASLRPGQSLSTISLDEALALFQLPRTLGQLPDGETVEVSIGRFGPYVKYGKSYVSLKKDDDPYTIGLERAIELIETKKLAEANRVIQSFASGLQVLNGRYGPYITDGTRNAKVPKDREPASLSEEECRTLIEQAPPPKPRPGTRKTGARAKTADAGASQDEAPKPATRRKKTATAATTEEAAPKPRARARKPSSGAGES